jgi:hypothetical protein
MQNSIVKPRPQMWFLWSAGGDIAASSRRSTLYQKKITDSVKRTIYKCVSCSILSIFVWINKNLSSDYFFYILFGLTEISDWRGSTEKTQYTIIIILPDFCLNGCKTRSLVREKQKLQMFENKLLTKICGPNRLWACWKFRILFQKELVT